MIIYSKEDNKIVDVCGFKSAHLQTDCILIKFYHKSVRLSIDSSEDGKSKIKAIFEAIQSNRLTLELE